MEASGITRLLEAWRGGDRDAGDRVFALVYDDLRALARRQLARLQPGQTLAPTVLVHETYLKLADRAAPAVVDRAHFFNLAARAMRHIVIDHVRRRQSQKRDVGVTLPLDGHDVRTPAPEIDLLAMDDALTELAQLDARQARIVELRFFGGLELKEIAAMLDTSERTVKRDWQKARAFLFAALNG